MFKLVQTSVTTIRAVGGSEAFKINFNNINIFHSPTLISCCILSGYCVHSFVCHLHFYVCIGCTYRLIIGLVNLWGLILEILVIIGVSLALTQRPSLSAVTTLRSLNSQHHLIGYTSHIIAYQH